MSAFGHVTASVQRRHPASLLLLGLPLLAALVGAVLALAFAKPAAETPHGAAPVAAPAGAVVSAGALRVTLPEGWTPTRTGPKLPGFEGAQAAFARSYDSDIAIALLPARSPSLLPPALDVATNPASARPRIQRAGAVRAYDYTRPGPVKDQRVLDIVVVPTTLGVATIACSSAVVAPDECAQALHGLRLAGGSFLPLSAESAFLAGLPDAVRNLAAQRVRLRTRLTRAGLVAGAARTAYRLAGAYGTADRALRPLAAPHSDARSTVILLRRLRSRYFTLAAALRARDRAAFKAAARSITTNEQRLAARIEAWQRALAG
jgi:hypothetical protein